MSSADITGNAPVSHVRANLMRAMSNVFLGIAVGILGYYGVTDVVTRLEQRALREAVPPEILRQTVVPDGPGMDFEAWDEQDRAYWEGLAVGAPFARIVSAKMGLDAIIVKGVERRDLMKGPGWIPYTDLPGPTGNCGVSGHRTTYGAPFRRLDRLAPGDIIELYSPFRRYTYEVRRSFEVTPDRVDVVASTDEPTLTLTACHPPYSARLRLIVQSDLVEVRRLEAGENEKGSE